MPFTDYIINFDFIVSEKCEQKDSSENLCQGKCYLAKEVLKQLETTEEKEDKTIQIDFVKIPHLLYTAENISNVNKDILFFKYKNTSEISNPKMPDIPPPKFYRFS